MPTPSIAHPLRRSKRETWLESLVKLGRRLTKDSKTAEPAPVAGDLR